MDDLANSLNVAMDEFAIHRPDLFRDQHTA
jgi:hypothetical protein